MPQVKPASGARNEPLDESHLPRPRGTRAGVRRGPDPVGHARALVKTHGLEQAIDIAKSNAVVTKERYWQEVFEAMSAVVDDVVQLRH
jgi:hypothetical protein